MERTEALRRIRTLEGTDLRSLADSLGITVWKGERINKGWAGHTVERFLGLPLNSAQSPNFGSWELKVVPLEIAKSGILRVKETMAITMIDPFEVVLKEFPESHLYNKLRKILIVSRVFESVTETRSLVQAGAEFDLGNLEIFEQVRADYDLVRKAIIEGGFNSLTGSMGVLVQPRTKGQGHGSTTRAFYARKRFVAKILGLPDV